MSSKKNICVYTSIIGGYEILNEQPEHIRSSADFICFSDTDILPNDTWRVVKIGAEFPEDETRSQRYIKLLQHPMISAYDFSIYIDNSVLLSVAASDIIRTCLGENYDLAISRHSFRGCVLDEFQAVSDLAYDEQSAVLKQLEAYARYAPDILRHKPYWCGIIIRRNGVDAVDHMMRIWFDQILLHSRRDQLSVNLAVMKTGPRLNSMDIDNNNSAIHSWPHAKGRRRGLTLNDMAREVRDAKAVSALVTILDKAGGGKQRLAPEEEAMTLPCQTLQVQAGSNTSGAGGEVSFGIAEFPEYLPMASVGGLLANAPNGETQGGISFRTRTIGASGQPLKEKMRINPEGSISLTPLPAHSPSSAGTFYFDKQFGLMISVDGETWRVVETKEI